MIGAAMAEAGVVGIGRLTLSRRELSEVSWRPRARGFLALLRVGEQPNPAPRSSCESRLEHPHSSIRQQGTKAQRSSTWRSLYPAATSIRSDFDIERLQLVGGEGEELAAGVFVSFEDLVLVGLLAGFGIVRPERDPGCGAVPRSPSGCVGGEEPPYRWRKTLLPSTPIRQVVLVHIERRWLPHLVQANGFHACRRRRQINRAGHQRKAQETSPTRPRRFRSP